MNQKDVEGLVIKFQAGDGEAFAKLYDYYYQSIYFFALKLSHNEADAKDIVQDTFAQVSLSINALKNPKLFKVWLNRIAFSKATRLFSKNKTVSFDPDESWVLNRKSEEAFINPHEQIRFDSDMEVLNQFLDVLPVNQKAVLLLMYFEQMNMQEIADVLDIPIGTVKSRIYFGKQKLQTMIEAYERENHMKLTFRANGIEALIVYAFAQQAKSMGIVALPSTKSISFQFSNFMGSIVGKVVIASVGAITVGTLYTQYQNLLPQNTRNVNTPLQKEEIELYPFQLVTYQENSYSRADDAYYALLEFAHCGEEIEDKTQAELKEIQPLYEELKMYGSIYYEKLQSSSWNLVFEKKLGTK